MGMEYVDRETLFRESDVISLHIPLFASTHHIIDRCHTAPVGPNARGFHARGGSPPCADSDAVRAVLRRSEPRPDECRGAAEGGEDCAPARPWQ